MPKLKDPKNMSGNELDKRWAFLTLSANQSSNLNVGDHVEFDTIQKSGTFDLYKDDLITPAAWDTDTGQDLGIIELKEGKTYKLTADLLVTFTGDPAYIQARWYDRTNSNSFGVRLEIMPASYTGNHISPKPAFGIITPSSDIKIELQIETVSNINVVGGNLYSCAMIEQIRDKD